MKYRAVILIPFYAKKFPSYFNYFIKSMEGMPFDVLLISDLRLPAGSPRNLKLFPLTFAGLQVRIKAKFGMDASLENPRKLCDYKPMYGDLFADLIGEYDYWGWGDCDLIYGVRMCHILENILEKGYDCISFTHDWMSGWFSLMRNTERMRKLYASSDGWRRVVKSKDYEWFDELGVCMWDDIFAGKIHPRDCFRMAESITSIIWRTEGIKVFRGNELSDDYLWHSSVSMIDGVLKYDEMEIPVYHYVKVKVYNGFEIPETPLSDIGDFWLDRYGVYSSRTKWRVRYLIHLVRWAKAGIRAVRYRLKKRFQRGKT